MCFSESLASHKVNYKVTTLRKNGEDFTKLSQRSCEASLIEFFFGDLSGAWLGLMPPLHVLNYFFARGGHESVYQKQRCIHYLYEWTPFQVTPDEYSQIVEALRQLPSRPFAEVEPPSDVRTMLEYEQWSFVRWMDMKHADYQRQKTDA
jgi:hypothetical protein